MILDLVLELEKRQKEKGLGCAVKTLRSLGAPDCPVVHRTVSSGAPDSVRCARMSLVKLAALGISSAAYG
jgi:hypothetical protein